MNKKRFLGAALALCMAGSAFAQSDLVSGLAGRLNNAATYGARSVAYQNTATGATARTVQQRLDDSINLLDFGADPTDTTDSTAAVNAFLTAVKTSGKCGRINSGKYKVTSALTLDLSTISPKGMCLYGEGQYTSMLDLSTVTASPAVQIIDTGNAGGGGFYSSFHDFGIKGNVAGTLLQLGKTDASDALNEFEFRNLWVGNSSTSASAIAIQVNYVLNTHFFAVIAANNGHGDAWQLTAAAFDDWVGGSGTYADNGFHWTASGIGCSCGQIAGNTFVGLDMEVNTVNHVKIDTSNAHDNTWMGGTMVYTSGTSYGIQATAGNQNLFTGIFMNVSGGASYSNFFNSSNAQGVALLNMFGMSAGLQINDPSFNAYLSAAQTLTAATWTKLTFNTTDYQNGTGFSTSTGRFTAVVPGRYEFRCHINENATNASAVTDYVGLYRNGSNLRATGFGIPAGTNFEGGEVTAQIVMSAGDYVECWANLAASSGSPQVQGTSTNSYFDGKYLGQ
ncbi:C1q domain-containing protein [Burkholderia sp. WP9]|uniref:C1q-like domain-containing protein n=1 Tax=Burkholderia sp. WP9 TaxID=1500263 RepID=UPI00089D7FC5|nr:hypothetical protein [Burkholderia sp. WP9]SEC35853.1 C1q domain-containing protein [Burkholderia sp. WP9]